jgi:hypothetical protein
MPTATDLVTDLPADFEVFGQAVATSMADLLGGTTGQVLSKTSNTDMDFTWVAQDDSNAIQNAIVDAKGDLIAASAADTPARLAVGTNGQVLTADSAEATGLKWSSPAATGFNGASAKNSFYQTLTTATQTALVFDTENFDSGSYWATGTNTRFTVPTTGKYSISANALFLYSNANTLLSLYKNGSFLQQIDRVSFTGSYTNAFTIGKTVVVSLTASDYVQLYGYQNTGSSQEFFGDYSVAGAMTWSITFLGA